LVIIIAAIVYHLYQDNGNVFFFDELRLVASPTHSNRYRSIPSHLKSIWKLPLSVFLRGIPVRIWLWRQTIGLYEQQFQEITMPYGYG
jgi:hypothetical protein